MTDDDNEAMPLDEAIRRMRIKQPPIPTTDGDKPTADGDDQLEPHEQDEL